MKIKELETNIILLGFDSTGESTHEWDYETPDIYIAIKLHRIDYIILWDGVEGKTFTGSDATVKALEHVVKLLGEANE